MHWDLVRQWIGSLGPVVAIGTAAVPYWRNSKDRRRAQAIHLYCSHSSKPLVVPAGDGLPDGDPDLDGVKALCHLSSNRLLDLSNYAAAFAADPSGKPPSRRLGRPAERVTFELSSTSEEPFFNITIWITDTQKANRPAASISQLEPQGRQRHYAYFECGTLPNRSLNIRLEFQDANGRRWQRTNTQPVKPLRRFTPNAEDASDVDYIEMMIYPKPNHYSNQERVKTLIPTFKFPEDPRPSSKT